MSDTEISIVYPVCFADVPDTEDEYDSDDGNNPISEELFTIMYGDAFDHISHIL